MEEADQLILNDLKTIGCQIPEEIKQPTDFTAPVLVHCILRCLRIWDKSREYPRSLANTRTQKVNQCNQIVKALKELGYTEDISYHFLLYPNAGDSRKLLSWLVSQVPIKENANTDSTSILNQKIEDEIDYLTSPTCVWTPDFCNPSADRNQNFYRLKPVHTRYLYSPSTSVYYPNGRRPNEEQKRYFAEFQPFYTAQVQSKANVAVSVLESNTRQFTEAKEWDDEWNSTGMISGFSLPQEYKQNKQKQVLSRMAEYIRLATSMNKTGTSESLDEFLKNFTGGAGEENRIDRAQKFGKDQKAAAEQGETEEELAKRREREKADIDKKREEVEARLLHTEQEIQVCNTEVLQLKATLQKEVERTAELKEQYLRIKETLKLLGNAEENIKKLGELAEKSKKKLLSLGQQWEEKRAPLVEEYRSLKDQFSKREDEIKKKLEEIKQIRAEIKNLKTSITRKDARHKELLEIYEKIPKETRTTYTNKIMVLVGGVKKQRIEITKILIDMKNVQKEINVISDRLQRIFQLVEDMIYQDAKKDAVGADSYRATVELHKVFTEITDTIQKIGQTSNSSLQLDDKIDKLEKHTTALNMQQIEEDLKQVREENAKLLAKYNEGKKKDDIKK